MDFLISDKDEEFTPFNIIITITTEKDLDELISNLDRLTRPEPSPVLFNLVETLYSRKSGQSTA